MPEFTTLDYRVDDGVAIVTFSRPEQMNTFSVRMMGELLEVLDITDDDDAVRAVVVTGTGRAFCAGADLGRGGETFDDRDGARTEDIVVDGIRRDGGGRVALR